MQYAKRIVVVAVLAAVLLAIMLILGNLGNGPSRTGAPPAANAQAANRAPAPAADNPFLSVLTDAASDAEMESLSWAEKTLQIIVRLLFAVILSGILAFRPQKDVPLFGRSLFVSQTQILLAVVAAALMMVVGDNAARAFAIFAAASLVRFRTNIRDPKEITVLLISLALGLAAGVGRWELGIALCLFALALLWLLEFNESSQVVRAMELTVKTKDTERTQEILKKIFKRMRLEAEVREIDPPDEKDPIGRIQYYLNLRINLSTDHLSDRILAADSENIERIQWAKTKSATDIYQ